MNSGAIKCMCSKRYTACGMEGIWLQTAQDGVGRPSEVLGGCTAPSSAARDGQKPANIVNNELIFDVFYTHILGERVLGSRSSRHPCDK